MDQKEIFLPFFHRDQKSKKITFWTKKYKHKKNVIHSKQFSFSLLKKSTTSNEKKIFLFGPYGVIIFTLLVPERYYSITEGPEVLKVIQ